MRIAIVGYGRMGNAIEKLANQESVEISRVIDDYTSIEKANFDKDEVAIEFTQPEAAFKNISLLIKKNIPVVCGTTGWYDQLEELKTNINNEGKSFLYGSNFSIGVNVFWQALEVLSKLINKVEEYDVATHEFHHVNKKDSPSGTGYHTAKVILDNIERKKKLSINTLANREILPEELHVTSTRLGNIIGEHEVLFDSIYDTIKISHSSKSRDCYAIGAIKAAKWLQDKKGFFNFKNVIGEIGNVKL